MSTEGMKTLYSAHLTSQEKYVYFLLAAAASGIAFAVQKTNDAVLSWQLCVLGAAVALWGASFYCGCRRITWVQTALMANYNLLQLQAGTHPEQPDAPQLLEAAYRGVNFALDENMTKARSYATWQFRFLLSGAVLFLVWHVLSIAERSGIGA